MTGVYNGTCEIFRCQLFFEVLRFRVTFDIIDFCDVYEFSSKSLINPYKSLINNSLTSVLFIIKM